MFTGYSRYRILHGSIFAKLLVKFAAVANKNSTMSMFHMWFHMWFQSWTASRYSQVLKLELWYDYNLDMHSTCKLSVYNRTVGLNRTLDKKVAFLQILLFGFKVDTVITQFM